MEFKIDAELGLAVLGIFAIVLIMAIILFVSRQLGIQTYNVLDVGSPCPHILCPEGMEAREVLRDWKQGIAYCSCPSGKLMKAPLFA